MECLKGMLKRFTFKIKRAKAIKEKPRDGEKVKASICITQYVTAKSETASDI